MPRSTRIWLVGILAAAAALGPLWLNLREGAPKTASLETSDRAGEETEAAAGIPAPTSPGTTLRQSVPIEAPRSASSAKPVRVELHVVESYRKDAQSIPGLDVEVGLAAAFEGAIFLGSERLIDPLSLSIMRVDERGRAEVDVDPDAGDGRRHVWARVVTPGWCQKTRAMELPTGVDAGLELRISARRGVTLRGVVLDPDGDAVADAEVLLHVLQDRRWSVRRSTSSDSEGAFLLHAEEMPALRIHARRLGLGVATLELPARRIEEGTEDLELRLRGASSIDGIVLDAADRPVRGLRVHATDIRYEERGWLVQRDELEVEGLAQAWADTDATGRFRISGLGRGDFLIHGHLSPWREQEPLLPGTFVVGCTDLRILYGEPRLEVSLVDPRGQPIALGADLFHDPDERLEEPKVMLLRATPDGRNLEPDQIPLPPSERLAANTVTFSLDREGDYLLAVLTPDRPPTSLHVYVAPHESLVERRVVLDDPVGSGTLELLVHAEGQPFGGRLGVTVDHALSGARLARYQRSMSGSRRDQNVIVQGRADIELAPGAYRVRAEELADRDQYDGYVMEFPEHAQVEEVVEIVAGSRTPLQLELDPGGWLRLKLDLPERTKLDGRSAEYLEMIGPGGDHVEGWRRNEGGYPVTLVPSDGRPVVRPDFYHRDRYIGKVLPWVLPGKTYRTVTALRPGDYEVVVEMEDGSRHSAQVTIRAGETTELTVGP